MVPVGNEPLLATLAAPYDSVSALIRRWLEEYQAEKEQNN